MTYCPVWSFSTAEGCEETGECPAEGYHNGQRPGADDQQGYVEASWLVQAGESKANLIAYNYLKGNYKHNKSTFSSVASFDTT